MNWSYFDIIIQVQIQLEKNTEENFLRIKNRLYMFCFLSFLILLFFLHSNVFWIHIMQFFFQIKITLYIELFFFAFYLIHYILLYVCLRTGYRKPNISHKQQLSGLKKFAFFSCHCVYSSHIDFIWFEHKISKGLSLLNNSHQDKISHVRNVRLSVWSR